MARLRGVGLLAGVEHVTVSAMPLAGLAWQTLPETGALALVDPMSRRAASVARPHPADLAMADIVEIERLALTWVQATADGRSDGSSARADAEAALGARLAVAPLDTLRAMCWLLGMWIVTVHVQTGQSPHVLVQAVAARPSWGHLDLPESRRLWESLTERVRTGILAALTGDPATVSAFAVAATVPAAMPEILLRHGLAIIAAVHEDMVARGLEPTDMASTVALYTTDPAVAPPSYFRPLE